MPKYAFQFGAVTFNLDTYGLINLEVEELNDTIDVTDGANSAGQREFIQSGRKSYRFTVVFWHDDAFLPITSGTGALIPFSVSTGELSYGGSCLVESAKITGEIDGAVQHTVSGRFSGAVTILLP
jgi:hypothetical protein